MCRMRPMLGTGVVMRSKTFQKGPSVQELSLSTEEDCPGEERVPGKAKAGLRAALPSGAISLKML